MNRYADALYNKAMSRYVSLLLLIYTNFMLYKH